MAIEFKGHLAASALLSDQSERWDGIFVIDSDMRAHPNLKNLTRRHLVLLFDDVERSTPGKISPTSAHVRQALEFSRESSRLLVSCRAGQSRSAALALLILASRNGVETAINFLDPSRHRPNRGLIRLGADLINEPFLPTALDRWLCFINPSLNTADIGAEIKALKDSGTINLISTPRA